LHFEFHGVKSALEQMDRAVVGIDHEVAIGSLRVFVSVDEKFESERFEHVVVGGLE
jgi:hypothetical protein